MQRKYVEYKIWENVTPKVITSSTDATPVVVTATSHGFATGDLVAIYGHTTNIATNGIYKVTKVNANSFSLQDRFSGADIAGSGAGAGADGVAVLAPKEVPYLEDFTRVVLQIGTGDTATMTIKWAISQGVPSAQQTSASGDIPNFGATVSKENPYTFDVLQDLSSGASLAGATGVVVAGTDIVKNFEAYLSAVKYGLPIITSFTQGSITLKLLAFYE